MRYLASSTPCRRIATGLSCRVVTCRTCRRGPEQGSTRSGLLVLAAASVLLAVVPCMQSPASAGGRKAPVWWGFPSHRHEFALAAARTNLCEEERLSHTFESRIGAETPQRSKRIVDWPRRSGFGCHPAYDERAERLLLGDTTVNECGNMISHDSVDRMIKPWGP